MNSYKIRLSAYHAIESADISIDGITVLSGKNGAGKSTIAQWLYHYVNASNDFEAQLKRHFVSWCRADLLQLGRVLRTSYLMQNRMRRMFDIPEMSSEMPLHQLEQIYFDALGMFEQRIAPMMETMRPDQLEWLSQGLGLPVDKPASEMMQEFFEIKHNEWRVELERYFDKKNSYRLSDLKALIAECPSFRLDWPKGMQFSENGLALISSTQFQPPVNLQRAIYIDTPMFLSFGVVSKNEHWERLIGMMGTRENPMVQTARASLMRIRRVIGGTVTAAEDELSHVLGLHYVRNVDNLDIPIEETATGIKSFAYLARLIENGYIDSNTLLLIDEPEAHLHPQWIVEFARVLVMMHKEIGVKIMVASHNPDMVAAIRAIALKAEVSDSTRFYNARYDENSRRYVYDDLGLSIEPIFESFNIALSRIEEYGKIV